MDLQHHSPKEESQLMTAVLPGAINSASGVHHSQRGKLEHQTLLQRHPLKGQCQGQPQNQFQSGPNDLHSVLSRHCHAEGGSFQQIDSTAESLHSNVTVPAPLTPDPAPTAPCPLTDSPCSSPKLAQPELSMETGATTHDAHSAATQTLSGPSLQGCRGEQLAGPKASTAGKMPVQLMLMLPPSQQPLLGQQLPQAGSGPLPLAQQQQLAAEPRPGLRQADWISSSGSGSWKQQQLRRLDDDSMQPAVVQPPQPAVVQPLQPAVVQPLQPQKRRMTSVPGHTGSAASVGSAILAAASTGLVLQQLSATAAVAPCFQVPGWPSGFSTTAPQASAVLQQVQSQALLQQLLGTMPPAGTFGAVAHSGIAGTVRPAAGSDDSSAAPCSMMPPPRPLYALRQSHTSLPMDSMGVDILGVQLVLPGNCITARQLPQQMELPPLLPAAVPAHTVSARPKQGSKALTQAGRKRRHSEVTAAAVTKAVPAAGSAGEPLLQEPPRDFSAAVVEPSNGWDEGLVHVLAATCGAQHSSCTGSQLLGPHNNEGAAAGRAAIHRTQRLSSAAGAPASNTSSANCAAHGVAASLQLVRGSTSDLDNGCYGTADGVKFDEVQPLQSNVRGRTSDTAQMNSSRKKGLAPAGAATSSRRRQSSCSHDPAPAAPAVVHSPQGCADVAPASVAVSMGLTPERLQAFYSQPMTPAEAAAEARAAADAVLAAAQAAAADKVYGSCSWASAAGKVPCSPQSAAQLLQHQARPADNSARCTGHMRDAHLCQLLQQRGSSAVTHSCAAAHSSKQLVAPALQQPEAPRAASPAVQQLLPGPVTGLMNAGSSACGTGPDVRLETDAAAGSFAGISVTCGEFMLDTMCDDTLAASLYDSLWGCEADAGLADL